MIIDRIRIKNLYGRNYDVSFKKDVSFLYGSNGCGKTVILKAVNAVLSGNYSFLKEADVEEIIVDIFKDIEDKTSDCIYISREDIDNDIYKLSNFKIGEESSSIFIGEEYDFVKADYIKNKMNTAFEDEYDASTATSIMKIANELLTDSGIFVCGLVNHDLCFSAGDSIFSLSRAGSGMIQLLYILTKVFLEKHEKQAIYLIDTPETHLHVSIQKRLVDVLMEYADTQVIIATHSPEIPGSLHDNMINVSGTRYRKDKS